jgi:dihydrofolate reductase
MEETEMSQVFFEISMSLDGYAAGPNQGPDAPLGEGGMELHEWVIHQPSWNAAHGESGGGASGPEDALVIESIERTGAEVMGRRMFGGGEGEWDLEWQGWWGDVPPFGHPVFVLTHHPREPLTLADTTFTFVTDGIESALEQARAAAGEKDVKIAGGAEAGQQYLAAGLLDQIVLHIAPVLLGSGSRLFQNHVSDGAPAGLELESAVGSDFGVQHLKYRVKK